MPLSARSPRRPPKIVKKEGRSRFLRRLVSFEFQKKASQPSGSGGFLKTIYAADASFCIIPKIVPSGSLQYASHPTPGTAIFSSAIDPPFANTAATESSTFVTVSEFTRGCSGCLPPHHRAVDSRCSPSPGFSPANGSAGPPHLLNFQLKTFS